MRTSSLSNSTKETYYFIHSRACNPPSSTSPPTPQKQTKLMLQTYLTFYHTKWKREPQVDLWEKSYCEMKMFCQIITMLIICYIIFHFLRILHALYTRCH